MATKKPAKPDKAGGKGATNGSNGVVAANHRAGRDKAMMALLASINKKLGSGAVMTGAMSISDVEFVSTGIVSLDAATGGGLPRGRIIEIIGVESCGKTTSTLEMIAECQRTNFAAPGEPERFGVAAFIDAEHSLDPAWARNVGVDWEELLVSQPSSGEEAFQLIEDLARSNLVDLIVVDSVSSLIPQEELDGEITDNKIGAQARLMSKGMRRIKDPVNKSKTVVIFINQIRYKVGVMFGSPETTSGGQALKFYASLRIDLRKGERVGGSKDKDGEKPIGAGVRAKIIKNKVAPPFQTCEYSIFFGKPPEDGLPPVYGVDKLGCLFDVAVATGVISQRSSFYYVNDAKIGAGRANSLAALRQNAKLSTAVRDGVLALAKRPTGQALSDLDDDDYDEAIDEADDGEIVPVDVVADAVGAGAAAGAEDTAG